MDAMLQVQVNKMLDSQEGTQVINCYRGQKVQGRKLCLMVYFSDVISAKMTKISFLAYLSLDTWPGKSQNIVRYDIDTLKLGWMHNFWVKYHKSNVGFENLAHLQSIENKCESF